MIRQGEKYVVETLEQFLERSQFDVYDVARALRAGDRTSFDYENSPDSIETLPDYEVWEIVEQYGMVDAIIELLEHDDGEWVHLYDGCSIHTVVELYPE